MLYRVHGAQISSESRALFSSDLCPAAPLVPADDFLYPLVTLNRNLGITYYCLVPRKTLKLFLCTILPFCDE